MKKGTPQVPNAIGEPSFLDEFGRDISSFKYELNPSPYGSIGLDNPEILKDLGDDVIGLASITIQNRMQAILYYQSAQRMQTIVKTKKGKPYRVDNPLIGAALMAARDNASDEVKKIIADAARAQDDYLKMVRKIPEEFEFTIFQISSAPSKDTYWLPRDPKAAARRIAMIRHFSNR